MTDEAIIHPKIKQIMVNATENDTTHIFRTLNNTARVFKSVAVYLLKDILNLTLFFHFRNKIALEVRAKEKAGATFPEIAPLVAGARGRKVYEDGDVDAGIWWASPVIGLVDEIVSCDALLKKMVADAEEILLKGPSYVVQEPKL